MKKFRFSIQEEGPKGRLDQFLAEHLPSISRSYIQKLVKEGKVLVNGKPAKSNRVLKSMDVVAGAIPDAVEPALEPVDISLSVLGETKDYIVVDKPAGMTVHPGVHGAHMDDSLVNALLYRCKGKLSGINGVMRPGIVHRLDKDTSGLIVAAKNDKAHAWLSSQFSSRSVEKVYYALLAGSIQPSRGTIDAPIARDVRDRKKMTVMPSGREALTRYEVISRYRGYSYVKVRIMTGRTHQIRVHFASIGFPVVGDPVYGTPSVNKKFAQKYGLKRQFLHAGMLAFLDPANKKRVEFLSPLPSDLQAILDSLEC